MTKAYLENKEYTGDFEKYFIRYESWKIELEDWAASRANRTHFCVTATYDDETLCAGWGDVLPFWKWASDFGADHAEMIQAVEELTEFHIPTMKEVNIVPEPRFTNIKRYAECCRNFARDTREWSGLDERYHYLTDGFKGWCKSPDGANGGIWLDWAFHETDNYINLRAAEYFFDYFRQDVENEAYGDCDVEGFDFLFDRYEDLEIK